AAQNAGNTNQRMRVPTGNTGNAPRVAAANGVRPRGNTGTVPTAAGRVRTTTGNTPRQAQNLSNTGSRPRVPTGNTGNVPRAGQSMSNSSVRMRPVSGNTGNTPRGAGYRPAPNRSTGGNPPRRRPPAEYRQDVFMENSAAVRRNRQSALTTIVLLAGVLLMTFFMVRQQTRYNAFRSMRAQVDQHDYFEGVTVEGLDVTGLTLSQAITYWDQNVEPQYANRTVSLSSGEYYSARELGYSSDYQTVLNNAWNAGRRGTLLERYQALSTRQAQVTDYTVTRSLTSEDRLEVCAQAVSQVVNQEPKNASIDGFDADHYTFRFTESVDGVAVDEEALANRIANTLEMGGGNVEVPLISIRPEITTEDVSSRYGMIASAVTDASNSDENRLSNIRRALFSIHGLSLEPGQKFSFNDVVGQRTEEAGFKVAHAYGNGDIIDEVGGGICQVSTTLFNAVVKADLKVTERHSHSMPVAYVDKGKDAAVNWKSKDLCFTNTSDDRIYICGYVTSDKRVRIGIFGRLLENGQTITVEAQTLEELEFDTEYKVNTALAFGVEKIIREGKLGYTAEAYKIWHDADGNETSRKLLCKSTYRPVSQIIEYGP
ncbi:MAG: VanW family protein, partial [Clostridia bacterium]|nr:VanW family protein [Clostridia bacterium]